jgi:hypothetical protein
MGVDIYLNSVRRPFWTAFDGSPAEQRMQTEVKRAMAARDYEKAMGIIFDAHRACGGYFRNGYNAGDVMWAMGFSWLKDVGSKLDAENRLSVDHARELVAKIEARPLTRDRLAQHFLANMTDGVEKHPVTGPVVKVLVEPEAKATGKVSPPMLPPEFESFSQFLTERREELLAILRKSIRLEEPLVIDL